MARLTTATNFGWTPERLASDWFPRLKVTGAGPYSLPVVCGGGRAAIMALVISTLGGVTTASPLGSGSNGELAHRANRNLRLATHLENVDQASATPTRMSPTASLLNASTSEAESHPRRSKIAPTTVTPCLANRASNCLASDGNSGAG